jgi:hypothetical protein
VGNSGTVFTEVNLEDGEWVDYDEKVRVYLPTDVYRIRFCFVGSPSGWGLWV